MAIKWRVNVEALDDQIWPTWRWRTAWMGDSQEQALMEARRLEAEHRTNPKMGRVEIEVEVRRGEVQ